MALRHSLQAECPADVHICRGGNTHPGSPSAGRASQEGNEFRAERTSSCAGTIEAIKRVVPRIPMLCVGTVPSALRGRSASCCGAEYREFHLEVLPAVGG